MMGKSSTLCSYFDINSILYVKNRIFHLTRIPYIEMFIAANYRTSGVYLNDIKISGTRARFCIAAVFSSMCLRCIGGVPFFYKVSYSTLK